MAVADMQIRYKKPALFDQVLNVETRAAKVKGRFLQFDYRVTNESGEAVVEASTRHVVVNHELKQASLPESILEKLRVAVVTDA